MPKENGVKIAKVGAVQAIVIAFIAGLFGLFGAYLQLKIKQPATASQIIDTFDRRLPVGTIVSSMIDPQLFSKLAGDPGGFDPVSSVWVPADGRDVAGSTYAKRVGTATPDLRGVFLRGLNRSEDKRMREDGKEDPDGNSRSAGDFQEYATGKPKIHFSGVTSTDGVHNHTAKAPRPYNSGNGNNERAKPDGTATTSNSGAHSHTVTISQGGDNETRPNNISVFYYIKIN